MHNQDVHKNIILEPGTALLFRHDAVRRCLKKIELTQAIDPVQDLWAEFLAYKYIESNQFVEETLKAVMLLYKNLLISVSPSKNNWKIADDEIDFFLEDKKNEIQDNFHCILNLVNSDEQEKDFLINNNLRMYLIRRLLKPMRILSKIKSPHTAKFWDCLYVARADHFINFKHEVIANCVDTMIDTKSFDSLFSLWHKFSSYLFIDDQLFLKEFVSLQYMIFSRLIDCLKPNQPKAPTPHEIIDLYDSVAALPMPEMLNSLDVLVEQLIIIMEKYEIDSAMSWTMWFAKYWWVPPVVLFSAYYNFFYKKNTVIQGTI